MASTVHASRPIDLDAFAYVVAHDLKAPLRSLHLFAEVLHEELADQVRVDQQGHFETLRDELRRMADLVEGVRRFAGVCAINGTTPDTRAAVEDAWIAAGGPGSGLHLRVGALSPLLLPPLHTATVLRALLQNAVLHGGGSGTVTVSESEGGLEVRDEGVGLPRPLHELMQPFLPRLDPPAGTGPGIGLALCQHILAHHGGRLEQVSSRKGAALRIVVPVH